MARMLYLRDSARFVLNVTRLHIRRCQQNPNGAAFILPIQTPVNVLKSKVALEDTAITNRQDAYDDVMLADFDLDNTVKNTSDLSSAYMRKHSTDLKVQQLFPSGGYSEITRAPYVLEPDKADALAAKIESFGNTHELYPLAAEIRTGTANVRTKIEDHKDAIRLQKAAEAEVEIAKLDVNHAYEVNYLNARIQLGSVAAERLFPNLSSPEKEETPPAPAQ